MVGAKWPLDLVESVHKITEKNKSKDVNVVVSNHLKKTCKSVKLDHFPKFWGEI